MRAFIVALGTRGDIELFLTLGRELRGRGHDVLFATSPFHGARVEGARLKWMPIGDSTLEHVVAILRSLALVPDGTQRTLLYYKTWLQPQLSLSVKQITGTGADTDYFISNLKMVLRRPGGVIPGAAVTYDPPSAVEDLPKYGTHDHGGMILDLVAMSKKLIDPEDKWGSRYQFTGFWRDEQEGTRQPAPGLQEFVEAGPPPVVLTMGSMATFDCDKLVRDFATAVTSNGQRGVVVSGWSKVGSLGPRPVRIVEEAPYDWLFPRACSVVHHGGCGTVAAVLRAGKPSIVLPQIVCQEHFARVLDREGLACGIFDVRKLDAAGLAAALRRTEEDAPNVVARQWRETIRAEGGVPAAVDLIEAHAAAVGLSPRA